MNKLYTVDEVAETLKLDAETIRRYINSKKIRAYKIGKEWRIKESDLLEFIERQSNISKEDKEDM